MAKIHFVKRARKTNPVVQKGESYYWWRFAFQPKQYSKTPPTRSQAVRSPFYKELYRIEDDITAGIHKDPDGFRSDVIPDIEQLMQECLDSRDNMPQGLQDSPSGELLQERADGLEEWINQIEHELDNVESLSGDEDVPEEDKIEAWETALETLSEGSGL